MADNIKSGEINETTKTFYVNQKTQTYPSSDSMGVSINKEESEYADGIQIPEKLVTINGNLHYHLMDATNVDWDQIKIPWATKITKWGSSGYVVDQDTGDLVLDENGDPILVHNSDMYNPSYNYNKPQNSWERGSIRESEEVADILNYLIYRVISLDYFMDHWDERNMNDPVLKLVNNRTDWYNEVLHSIGITPDILDNDDGSTIQTGSDNRLSANKNSNLIVVLYPELISNQWQENPESDPILFNGGNVYGVLISDLGKYNNGNVEDIYRTFLYDEVTNQLDNTILYYPVSGKENYDIYLVTTQSTSKDITFYTDYNNILYCNLDINMDVVDIDDANASNTSMRYKYNCPIIALGCFNKYQGKYAKQGINEDLMKSQTVLQYLVRHNIDRNYTEAAEGSSVVYGTIGATDFNDEVSNFIRNNINQNKANNTDTEIGTNAILDPDNIIVNFSISISRTNIQPIYGSEEAQYNVQIMKGENAIKDFYLEGHRNVNGNSTRVVRYNSYKTSGHTATLPNYTTIVTIPTSMEVYNDTVETAKYKRKIVWSADYDDKYDSTISDDRKKCHIKPMFYVKPEGCGEDRANLIWENCLDSEMLHNIELVHGDINNIVLDPDNDYSLTVFKNASITENGEVVDYLNYGEIRWEYDGTTHTSDYWYYPPAKTLLGNTEQDQNIVIYMFLYYEYDNITTTRTVKPVVAALPVTLKPIVTNHIVFYDGKRSSIFYKWENGELVNYAMNQGALNSEWFNTVETDGVNRIKESYYINNIEVDANNVFQSGKGFDYAVYNRDMSKGDDVAAVYIEGSTTGANVPRQIAVSKYNADQQNGVTAKLVGYVLPDFSSRIFDQENFDDETKYENGTLGLIRLQSNIQSDFDPVDVEYPMEMTQVKEYFKLGDIPAEGYNSSTGLWTIPTEMYINDSVGYGIVGVKYPCEMHDGEMTPYKIVDVPLIHEFQNNSSVIPVESVKSVKDILNGDATATTASTTNAASIVETTGTTIKVKASTAIFPEQNGIVYKASEQYTHNADDTYTFDDFAMFDADRDYYWLAFKITAPAHYNVTDVRDFVYDECSGYYFLKVTRLQNTANISNVDTDGNLKLDGVVYKNATSIQRNIYLDKITSVSSLIENVPATGRHYWSMVVNTDSIGNELISTQLANGGATINMSPDNFHIYNVGENWTCRRVRPASEALRSDWTNIYNPDPIDYPEPIGVVTYDPNTDVFGNAGIYTPANSDIATLVVADDGKTMQAATTGDIIGSANYSIQSLGAMLYVDKIEGLNITEQNITPEIISTPNGINVTLQYDLSNDLLYKRTTVPNVSIKLTKREYDIILQDANYVTDMGGTDIVLPRKINTASVISDLKAITTLAANGNNVDVFENPLAHKDECIAVRIVSNMLTDQNTTANDNSDIITDAEINTLKTDRIVGNVDMWPVFKNTQVESNNVTHWQNLTPGVSVTDLNGDYFKIFVIHKYESPTHPGQSASNVGWRMIANKNKINSNFTNESPYEIHVEIGDSSIFNAAVRAFLINVVNE